MMFQQKGNRYLAAVLAALMVLACLSGCSQTQPSSSGSESSQSSESSVPVEPVNLEFWFEGVGPERTVLFEEVVKQFNEKNEAIQVEGMFVAADSMNDKLNVGIAADSTPALSTIQDGWLNAFVLQNAMLDLTDRFEAWDEKSNFDASYITAAKRCTKNDKIYAIPTDVTTSGIWYRKDIYAEKGAAPITSWDTFFEGVDKTTDKSDASKPVYGMTIRGDASASFQLTYALIAYVGGTSFFDDQGKAAILRSEAAEEFITKYTNLFKDGKAPESSLTASYTEMIADFDAGVANTMFHNLGSYENQKAVFTPDQYAFVPFPQSVVTGKYTTFTPGFRGIAIYEKTAGDADACWEFVKHYASREMLSYRVPAVGEMPTRTDSMQDDWINDAPHLVEVLPFTQSEKDLIDNPKQYLADYQSIQKNIGTPALQAVMAGQSTAAEYLDTLATELEKAYAEYAKNR